MGSGSYRDEDLSSRKKAIADAGGDTFAYTSKMKSSRSSEEKCHPLLAINKKRIRESRDSATHPKSNSLALVFDVTGSMGQVPRDLEANLKDLMGYFLKSDYLPDVAILFSAVGDSTCDRVPLQIGEFEPAAQELMDFFQRVFLEGRGGGQNTESYQNAIYFMARHTQLDCLEKRGKKGYLIMFGDELPYDQVDSSEIKALMGDDVLKENISLAQIIKEVEEKYVVLFVIPLGTSGGRDPQIWKTWRKLLGDEHVLGMEKTDQVCELVGTVVGVCEGKVNAQEAAENLRKKGFGKEYLDIAKAAFQKLYGINKDAKENKSQSVSKPANTRDIKKDGKKKLKI